MIRYRNTSVAPKTFYGITFGHNECKEVPGYINDPCMIRVLAEPKKPTSTKINNKKVSPQSVNKQSAVSKPTKETKQGGESDGSDNNK